MGLFTQAHVFVAVGATTEEKDFSLPCSPRLKSRGSSVTWRFRGPLKGKKWKEMEGKKQKEMERKEMESRLSFEKVWPWALKFVHIYQLSVVLVLSHLSLGVCRDRCDLNLFL